MELKLYANKCLTCDEGDRLHKVRRFAQENNLTFKLKNAYIFPAIKHEAEEVGVPMPFIQLGDKTMNFYELTRNPITTNELQGLL